MPATTTLKELTFESALGHLDAGAAFVDLRPTDDYLDVHVPGALSLVYEFGPGMSTRARDCIPLEVPLILLEDGAFDTSHAAASLRGKGFHVLGSTTDAVNRWVATGGKAGSTEVVSGTRSPGGLLLDVADPGARPPDDIARIPADELWRRTAELTSTGRVTIVAGYGVRAGLAVGILEREGVAEIIFWKTRPGGTTASRYPYPSR
jgi:rhodanese-related sulfurtransferase